MANDLIFVTRHKLLLSLTFVLLLMGGAAVYQPALDGPFMLDDFDNLGVMAGGVTVENVDDYLSQGNAGPLGRPISKLSFLIDDNAWPSEPANFKRTNLYIHLCIGVFVFILFRKLLRLFFSRKESDWMALFVMAVFILHPLQVSTVMYVVQRMTQLASLFTLIGLAGYCWWRSKYAGSLGRVRALIPISVFMLSCGLLAAFSKESGVLLTLYVSVIELTVFSKLNATKLFRIWRASTIYLSSLGLIAYIAYWPRWMVSYSGRDYSIFDRLATQPIVLFDYLSSILNMGVAGLGLFHDDYVVRTSFTDPMVLAAVFAIVVMILLAFLFRRTYPLVSLGVLWFFAGHALESTTVNLELYFEHRNYLALLGPVLVVMIGVYSCFKNYFSDLTKIAPVFAVIVVAICGMSTSGYAGDWSSLRRIVPIWAVEHPESPRAQRTYAQLLASIDMPESGMDTLDDSYKKFPYDLSMPIMSIDIACTFGLRQRYDLAELAGQVHDHRLTDGLRPALKSLFTHIQDSSCGDQTDKLHKLVAAIPDIQKGESLRGQVASYFVMDGDLYMTEGNGNGALKSYRIVDLLKPSVDSALRIANFYIRVKDFKNARASLALAYDREGSSRKGLSVERKREFEQKFDLLDALEKGPTPILAP